MNTSSTEVQKTTTTSHTIGMRQSKSQQKSHFMIGANEDGGSTSSPYQEPVNLETRPL